jgi:transcriptional regulator with XRE-family HTH domain
MKNLDPMRDDAGARLRTLRLRRGIPLAVLGGLSGVTPSFLSMVENGHRELRRWSDILALASALEASPLYLAFGNPETPGARAPSPMPFPAGPDAVTLRRHERLARELAGLLAHGDGRAAGDWLRRLAREPSVSPWLLIDQLASTASSHAPALFHAGVARTSGRQP